MDEKIKSWPKDLIKGIIKNMEAIIDKKRLLKMMNCLSKMINFQELSMKNF